jgi:dihydroorotate dehydrogenase (NAD+) catalytic subunit
MDLSVNLCGIALKNPIIPASGTFGFGREISSFYDLSRLGALNTKGLTLHPRIGNEPPRIAESPSGVLNAVGLQNPGIDAFLRDELPFMLVQGPPVIANIAGETVEEFALLAEKLDCSGVAMLEVNVSCPNVSKGGRVFGADCQSIEAVTTAVKRSTCLPVMVKLSPNVGDIVSMAKAAESSGADAVSLINTLTGMAIDVATRRSVLANVTGGLSGPAIRPVALRMAWQAVNAVSIPVVGMGGIMTGEDAAAFLLAGCTAVEVGTAHLRSPTACIDILSELETLMQKQGVSSLRTLIGALRTD